MTVHVFDDGSTDDCAEVHPEPAWAPVPYRVRVREDEGPAYWIKVNAIGPKNAADLARMKAYDEGVDVTVLGAEEVAA